MPTGDLNLLLSRTDSKFYPLHSIGSGALLVWCDCGEMYTELCCYGWVFPLPVGCFCDPIPKDSWELVYFIMFLWLIQFKGNWDASESAKSCTLTEVKKISHQIAKHLQSFFSLTIHARVWELNISYFLLPYIYIYVFVLMKRHSFAACNSCFKPPLSKHRKSISRAEKNCMHEYQCWFSLDSVFEKYFNVAMTFLHIPSQRFSQPDAGIRT